MYNPEDDWIRNMDRESSRTGPLFMTKVADLWKKTRSKFPDFADVYSPEEIEQDKIDLKTTKEKLTEKESEKSEWLSYGIMQGIHEYGWLGNDCSVVQASEYDDVKRGIDFFLCFTKKDGTVLTIGIDATVGQNIRKLDEKIEKSRSVLRKGEMPEVKYYSSESEPENKGTIRLPRLVLGANPQNTTSLCEDFESLIRKRKKGEVIEHHEIQYALMEELQFQLAYFIEFTTKAFLDKNKSNYSPVINDLITLWNKSYDQKDWYRKIDEEFKDLFNYLESNKENLIKVDQKFGQNIFDHIEAFKVIEDKIKEKGSNNKDLLGATDGTIDFLKHPGEIPRAA